MPNRVMLAPMSGITDAPFRRLVARLGAGLVIRDAGQDASKDGAGEDGRRWCWSRERFDCGLIPTLFRMGGLDDVGIQAVSLHGLYVAVEPHGVRKDKGPRQAS